MTSALMPDIEVSIGFGIPPIADEDDYSFTDISSYVFIPQPNVQGGEPIVISRGRQSALSKFEAGQCNMVLRDPDRRFDPTNLASPYYPYVRPMARLRVRARWPKSSGTWVEIFNGYIDTWEPVRIGVVTTLAVKIRAVDAFGTFNRIKFTDFMGAGQPARVAFGDILDDINWPDNAAHRDLDTGATTRLVSRDYENANALTSLQDIGLAENGALYIDREGRVVFHSREWRGENRTVAAIFGNTADTTSQWILGTSILGRTTVPRASGWISGTVEETQYTALTGKFDDRTIINDAHVTRVGGTEQTAGNTVSQTDYGMRSYTESSIVQTDADALSRAQYLAARYGTPEYRVDSITTELRMMPTDAMKQAIYDDIDIEAFVLVYDRRGPGQTDLVMSECRIEGVNHTITWHSWRATYRTSSDPAFWILEDEVLGILEETTILGW